MTPVSTSRIVFETEVGNVEIFSNENRWVYEFTSGWNNGLHSCVPYISFDKCYSAVKSRMKEWNAEQKNEQF